MVLNNINKNDSILLGVFSSVFYCVLEFYGRPSYIVQESKDWQIIAIIVVFCSFELYAPPQHNNPKHSRQDHIKVTVKNKEGLEWEIDLAITSSRKLSWIQIVHLHEKYI